MMGDYTFVLKDVGGAGARELSLVCLTDADAMLIARGLGGARDIEVWVKDRLVGKVWADRPHRGGVAA
jgi:hypothetical protein